MTVIIVGYYGVVLWSIDLILHDPGHSRPTGEEIESNGFDL